MLIFWMFIMGAVAYLDRVNISIAGQAIQKDFGLTDLQLGWVFSAFVIGYALFQVPGVQIHIHIHVIRRIKRVLKNKRLRRSRRSKNKKQKAHHRLHYIGTDSHE